MTNTTISEKKITEDIFYTFADFFKYPTVEFFDELASGELDQFLNDAFKALRIEVTTDLKQNIKSFSQWQKEYMNCFSGIISPFSPPVESIYKVWTRDRSAQVSIAGSKGYLMGDSALHMQHLLKQYNCDVPEGYENMPDHLSIILEFCAVLHEHGTEKQIIQFMKDHLDWLPLFRQELEKLPDSQMYCYITQLLENFISMYLRNFD